MLTTTLTATRISRAAIGSTLEAVTPGSTIPSTEAEPRTETGQQRIGMAEPPAATACRHARRMLARTRAGAETRLAEIAEIRAIGPRQAQATVAPEPAIGQVPIQEMRPPIGAALAPEPGTQVPAAAAAGETRLATAAFPAAAVHGTTARLGVLPVDSAAAAHGRAVRAVRQALVAVPAAAAVLAVAGVAGSNR